MRHGEQGYILMALMLVTALMLLGLTLAMRSAAADIRREREIEMIHRGEQYERAIQHYYAKFGRYPSRLEELENTNNIRFLRKRYKDPLSPSGEWKLLHVGDVQMGLAAALNGSSAIGQSNSSSTSGLGQQTSMAKDTTTASSTTASSTTDVMGGGPIIGVCSTSTRSGMHEFAGKAKYSDWKFVYDPSKKVYTLLRGPYNPNAFVGKFAMGAAGATSTTGGASSTTSGSGSTDNSGSLPNIPGVTGSGGVLSQ